MDIVYIRELEIQTVIGIYDWERKIRQTVSLDLDMATDIRAAASTEDISNTLDYKAVSKRLIAYIEEAEFLLIETMAERVAELVLAEFPVNWLRLRVGKPGAVTGARDVGVIIERGEQPQA
ncbi:MAG TPA: dihydroneopterin aldolase [Pseudohongiella sp.]|nr:dihydroneopterin aldolase [Pseudohongiella sp.]MAY55955.1 dihydroneopterin aldolase [Gammaproteobacteria bacterium]MBJ55807.1 dihydroneopterin aldolase [Gammaproteobacteria bacterium]HBN15094.1 dihydroneopterin aldolase [Pseudohongiella sp.]HBX37121.1 dihydroneopterin aldolase [Pseudohongiella sp.]|tara:strand:- start:15 stop:377 length:363 start_codon:yes stop_codon:yes gene_type:complete